MNKVGDLKKGDLTRGGQRCWSKRRSVNSKCYKIFAKKLILKENCQFLTLGRVGTGVPKGSASFIPPRVITTQCAHDCIGFLLSLQYFLKFNRKLLHDFVENRRKK